MYTNLVNLNKPDNLHVSTIDRSTCLTSQLCISIVHACLEAMDVIIEDAGLVFPLLCFQCKLEVQRPRND